MTDVRSSVVPMTAAMLAFALVACSPGVDSGSQSESGPGSGPVGSVSAPSDPSPTTFAPTTATPTTSAPTTSSTTTTTVPDITADLGAFDRVVEDDVIGGGSRDVSVAIVRDGTVLHTFTAAKGRPGVDPATPFRLASVSKTITTIVALMLVEQGLIDLDSPVVGEIADRAGFTVADPRAREITLRQLLSNTSGIDSHLDYFFAPTDDDVPTMLQRALDKRLFDEPGGSYRYSNVNFQLVGLLLEQASGENYESLVRRLLFEPLGFSSFRYAIDDANVEGEPDYSVSGGRRYMLMLGPGGAWTGSASEIALLVDALRWGDDDRRPLDESTVDEMFSAQTPEPADRWWDYGLGVRIFESGAVGHTGTIESVHTLAFTRPDGLTFAILVNGWHPLETDELFDVLFRAELAARGLAPN